MSDWQQRVIRTFLQLLASGALTAFFTEVTGLLSVQFAPLILALFQMIVTFAQNYLEDTEKIPTILKDDNGTASDPRVI